MECKLKIVPSYHRRILDLEGLLESKEPITLILQRTKLRLKGINEEYFFFVIPIMVCTVSPVSFRSHGR